MTPPPASSESICCKEIIEAAVRIDGHETRLTEGEHRMTRIEEKIDTNTRMLFVALLALVGQIIMQWLK